MIGGNYQTIISDPLNPALLIDTTSDSSAISGVYGPIPGVGGAASGYDLDIGFLQYQELNTPPDGTSLSIIIVGDDPAKSLQIGIGSGKIWYYDENFDMSAPIVDLGPNEQYSGGFYVSWDGTSATLSGDAFWPAAHTVPLFDYRTAASTRIPGLSGIYSQPNTLFIGDAFESEPTFLWVSRTVVEYRASVVPLPSAFLFLTVPGAYLLSLRRRSSSIQPIA